MCNPMIAAAGVGVLGGVLQGFGAAQQREQNAVSNEMAAEGLNRDIGVEREASAYEIAKTRQTIAKTQGSARAGYAANGLALDGSAADVLASSAQEGDLDIEMIRWNSGNKIATMGYQRDTYTYNAGQERGAKGLAFISPIIGSVAKFGGSF